MTRYFSAGDLVRQLQEEKHEVRLHVLEEHEIRKQCFDGLVEKSSCWQDELEWLGMDGLIIFDDSGFGKLQDELRQQGYAVFGGSEKAEAIELDREYGQRVFVECGLTTVPLFDFASPAQALDFVRENPARWVIKQNEHLAKDMTYVGHQEDGSDVMAVLEMYAKDSATIDMTIALHRFIDGIEIGVGRYFNGKTWVGPIEINLEHKRFFPGNLGPMTSEMGTLAWYSDNENEYLFKKVLEPMTQFLRDADFRGDFEINCMVNADGVFPLEATARLGTPIIHLHQEIHQSPWGEFLYAVARGEQYNLSWQKGYGIVILLAVPPFPYTGGAHHQNHTLHHTPIYLDNVSKEDRKHIYFEDVSYNKEHDRYHISGHDGYVGYVASVADTVEMAQRKVYDIAEKIIIPKVMYRNDIGNDFIAWQYQQLCDWGYLE